MTTSTEISTVRARRLMAGLMISTLALAAAQPAAAADAVPSQIPLLGLGAAAAVEADDGSAARTIPLLLGATPPVAPAAQAARIELGPTLAAPAVSAAMDAGPTPQIASLWPLDGSRASGQEITLNGEAAGLDFALFAPPGEDIRQIAIAAVSSAFILPRQSVLRVFVDRELIGEQPLESITEFEAMIFAVPAGLIRPGLNRIRVEVGLAHRLYCGAEASYDLWTKLDLAGSGGVMKPAAPAEGPLAFLAAAGVARGQGLAIVIRNAAGEDAATPEQIQEISRQLGRAMGGGLRFATDAPAAGADPRSPIIELRHSGAMKPVFRAAADGAQVLEVRANGSALPPLFAERPVAELLPTLPELPLDVPVPLSRLGFPTVGVSGHLWSRGIDVRLPEDWLVDVKDRAILRLDFAHLGGLPTGSELRVSVNGEVVRLIPLDRGARAKVTPLEIRFDAADLQAGRNELSFEVSVPGDPADQPCLAVQDVFVEIRDTSTLEVPSSPRMRLPGIASWFSSGGGLSVAVEHAPGSETGRLAALHELTTALDGTGPDDAGLQQRRLVMLRPDELGSAELGEFGLSRSVLLSALKAPRAAASAAGGDAAPALEVVSAGIFGLPTDKLQAGALAAFNHLRRLAAPDSATELVDWLGGAKGQAILLQLDPKTPQDVYLLLSEDADPAAVARAVAAAARRGAPLGGHLALLDREGNWTTWRDPARLPVLDEALSERNWRGVLGNFASARPRIFVGALICVALLSVLIANSYIAASRRAR